MKIKRIKKKLFIICIILFVVIQYHYKSFRTVLGTNEYNITKVGMQNGNSGGYVSTTDKEKIKELFNLVNKRYYGKSIIQLHMTTGYSYYFDFYVGDKVALRMLGSGNLIELNNKYYIVTKSVDNDSLTSWFNSLPVSYY
ncbi:MAG: hypothetical protein H7Y18_05745 [Clostridiaceae bacterium]|nr:hypothetical protein [Clostridiaceae bacterium]